MKNLKINVLSVLLVAFAFTSCGNDEPIAINPPLESVIENLNNGIIEGILSEEYTLDSAIQYRLSGSFIIDESGTLNIPGGTTIIADAGGTEVYIAVLQGGKININGNAGSPVLISSANGSPGDWGGLTLCGKASTSAGVDASAEVGGFIYGGTDDVDSSGIIRYLQIVGTGAQINPESQYNGISFYGVGSGTLVDHIAIINGSDDGVEFFGGTVAVSNLYLENNDDDSIDWTEGWSGTVTNAYISHTIAGFSTAFEGDKDNANPTFTNITAVSYVGGTALQFKKESGATISGLRLVGYDVDLDMKDNGVLSNVQIDGATADAVLYAGETNKYKLNSGNDAVPLDVSRWSWIRAY